MTQITTTTAHGPVQLAASSGVALTPLKRGGVVFSPDGFFGAWQTLNSTTTIPHCISELENSGAVDNFRRLVGESDAPYRGPLFADSDVYKVLEAIAWEVGRAGTRRYDPFVDGTIALIGRVQTDDGYVNTWVQGGMSDQKLTDMRWSHELYCLGHLIQASIAWQRAVDRTDLMEIAIRYVDLVERELGPGGRSDVDGHPEIESALVELWRATGERRFLELAKRFIDIRGHHSVGDDRLGYEYFQDHEPLRDVQEATGHAVRQIYLATGATDVVIEEDDPELESALDRVWNSIHHEKMYVTGGLGSRHRDESFGDPYELPPDRAYSETCAAIANFMWNWRLLLRSGESRFADEMERGIYNAIAASTSLSGTDFFYANPLQLREGHRSEENAPAGRRGWYSCACCPPNLARLVASLDNYVASRDATGVQIHLYGNATIALGAGVDAPTATVTTDYPWDGRVTITFDGPLETNLRLRVPGWATDLGVLLDGVAAELVVENGYLLVPTGAADHSVQLQFGADPSIEHPHPRIDAARGTVAIRRGPIVYCIEQADLPDDVNAQDVYIPDAPELRVAEVPVGLDVPAVALIGAVERASGRTPLYSSSPLETAERELGPINLIPYFRWGNRRQAAMRVWIPTQ